jgi:hypothetical protein
MVKRIKKVKKTSRRPRVPADIPWYVPFDAEGNAGVFIHKHGDTDDHSQCGPVVMCCERALAPYKALAPDLTGRIDDCQWQRAGHLTGWFDNGLGAMYFVLCDSHDETAIYQFGLGPAEARDFLLGKVPHDAYRLPERRFTAD